MSKNLLTNVMAQVCNEGGGMIYGNDKKHLTVKTGFTQIVPDSPADISALHHISIGYQDLLGNEYIVNWMY